MPPQEFLSKWRNVNLKERTASQSHFNDLCRLLEVEEPIAADRLGEWFTFEKGATKSSGGEGWADVWRKGCFAWEYKGRQANLDEAFDQLLRYSIALESPPLLIVSDMERIRIHTNWTNTVRQVHEIVLEDLADAAKRDVLRAWGLTPDVPAATYVDDPRAQAIAAAAEKLNQLRDNWLNPKDLVRKVQEIEPQFPDRLMPVDHVAAQELKKRTLTSLYNLRPSWLDLAHRALDEAVADAYGWGDDFRAGNLDDDEAIARLFQINQKRSTETA